MAVDQQKVIRWGHVDHTRLDRLTPSATFTVSGVCRPITSAITV